MRSCTAPMVFIAALASPAYAATITVGLADLPGAAVSDVLATYGSGPFEAQTIEGDTWALRYTSSTLGDAWLVHYDLRSDSVLTGADGSVVGHYSGPVWLGVQDQYSMTGINSAGSPLQTPATGSVLLFGQFCDPCRYDLYDNALRAGFGTQLQQVLGSSYISPSSTMLGPTPMTETSVVRSVRLDFVNLSFDSTGKLGFITNDPRSQLYWWSNSPNDRNAGTFYVDSVPLPAGAWLFGSALAILVARRKRVPPYTR